MPRERLSMRKIKELLRLRFERGLSTRQIAASLGIGVGSVHDYLARARLAGLTWPLPADLTEESLETKLFPPPPALPQDQRPLPDWSGLAKQLKRKGVTLLLLWEEYRHQCPEGLGYSQFCKRFRDFQKTLDPRMRQSHRAGEKLFVDYAGLTLPLTDPDSGDVRDVSIFVASLGASSYTYAEATLTQTVADWIGAHERAFVFFGGVPELLVCDNLRSGVHLACRYEPTIQRTYEEMAAHYGTAVLPARPYKPRDKPVVEAGVQAVEERVLAPLRDRQFFSLSAINEAIAPLLAALNARTMQGTDHSRADLFAEVDRPALLPLPAEPFPLGVWAYARVHIDYHIAVDDRYYSVPFTLLGHQVEVRTCAQTVEVFFRGERVASHARVAKKYGRSTQPEHMPESHRAYAEWTPERIVAWLAKTGEATKSVGEAILGSRAHPQQGFRACLGLVRLSGEFGAERTEAACRRALAMQVATYTCVKTLLRNNLDGGSRPAGAPVDHENIRGAAYFVGEAPASTTRGSAPE